MKYRNRICIKCNIEYKEGEIYCVKCGRKLGHVKTNPEDRKLEGWAKSILGKEYLEVHKWLDELFCNHMLAVKVYGRWNLPYTYIKDPTRHRCIRHNREGLDYIEKKWGKEARKAGEIHILTDFRSDGYKSKYIPKDSKEYLDKGLW